MTCIVSSGALNSTHSLTQALGMLAEVFAADWLYRKIRSSSYYNTQYWFRD